MALCLLIVIQLLAFFSFKKNLCCMLFKIVVGIVGIAGSESAVLLSNGIRNSVRED